MNASNIALKRRIMRRVYAIAALRMLLHPVTMKAALAGALAWKSTDFVSYAAVFANVPKVADIERQLAFFHDAIVATDGATMLVLTMTGVVATWIVFDIFGRKQAYI